MIADAFTCANAMLNEHGLSRRFALVEGVCRYNLENCTIEVDAAGYYSWSASFILKLCHEVGHVIQHHRWPIIFAMRKWWIIGYFITLFLEWDASRRAIDFMQVLNILDNEYLLKEVKKEAFEGLKSYL